MIRWAFALLVAGVASQLWPVGVVGFLVMLGGGWWASTGWQSGQAASPSTTQQPRKSAERSGFMTRIEERWETATDPESHKTLAAMYGSAAFEAQQRAMTNSGQPPYWSMFHRITVPTLNIQGVEDAMPLQMMRKSALSPSRVT